MKTIRKVIAFAAALAVTTSASGVFTSNADRNYDLSAYAAEQSIPEWVPQSFMKCLDFTNEHGSTLVQDNLACMVLKVSDSKASFYNVSYSGTAAETIDDEIIYHKEFACTDGTEPDSGVGEIYFDDPGYHFEVFVYKIKNFSTLNVNVETGVISKGKNVVEKKCEFIFSKKGENGGVMLTQEDIFSWLPDCASEFGEFEKKNGSVSAHGEYVVYCGEVNYSTGCTLEVEQSGTAKLEEIMSFTANNQTVFPLEGSAENIVKVFKAVKAGNADISFKTVRFDDTVVFEDKNNITVNKDLIPIVNAPELPAWVPQDFDSAMEFDYKYGLTHTEDGYICVVQRIYNDVSWEQYATLETNKNTSLYDILEVAPVFRREYVTDKGGMYGNVKYSVNVYKPEKSGTLRVALRFMDVGSGNDKKVTFDVNVGEKTTITETDYLGWAPDSVTEAEKFISKNGNVSAHGEYAIYCGEIPLSAGYDLSVSNDGVTWLNNTDLYYVSRIEEDPGTPTMTVALYKAQKPGDTTVTFSVLPFNDGNDADSGIEPVVKTFRADKDLNLTVIDKKDKTPLRKGDCNYDGYVGIADLVTLQDHLLGRYDFINADNSDVNSDGRINMFDLMLLKRQLFNKEAEYAAEPEPLLAVVYENHAWGDAQYMTVYDTNGKAYKAIYAESRNRMPDENNTYDKMINFRKDGEWYDQLCAIIKDNDKYGKNPDGEYYNRLPDGVVYESRSLAEKLGSIKDAPMGKGVTLRFDGGNESVYIFGKVDGKPVVSSVCTTGDYECIRDDENVYDFVKTLVYNGMFRFTTDYHSLMKSDIENF